MENIKLDIQVRRISNGFIVKQNGSDVEYYTKSMLEYVSSRVSDELRAIDDYFNTHNADGEEFTIKAASDLFEEQIND